MRSSVYRLTALLPYRLRQRSHCRGHRRLVSLPGPDPEDLGDVEYDELAVADLAGAGAAEDRIDGHRHERLGNADLQANLLLQFDLDGGAAVGLHVFGLAAMPQHPGHGEAADFSTVQRLQHFV